MSAWSLLKESLNKQFITFVHVEKESRCEDLQRASVSACKWIG